MDISKRKEITKKAAELAIEHPELSMRELARQIGGTTSTTLKKFFDEILPEEFPDLKKQYDEAKENYKVDKERIEYESSAKYRRKKRQLVRIEETTSIADYIINEHATLQMAAKKYNLPIARIQRGINLLREANVEYDEKLDRIFEENKVNYYKKLGDLTKKRIEALKKAKEDAKTK